MYKGNSSVGSYLVDNGAWNVICNRFNDILGTSDSKKTITDSTKWGNYTNNTTTDYSKINGLWALYGYLNTGAWDYAITYKTGSVDAIPNANYKNGDKAGWNKIELGTGLCDDFKLYNIYDMAGNMWEWTTGHNIKNGIMFVVPRGGSFSFAGSDDPVVSAHGYDGLTSYYNRVGFRVVLYIQ